MLAMSEKGDDVLIGDLFTKKEMKMRGIVLMPSQRGGVELRAKNSMGTIAEHMQTTGFIEYYHINDASVFLDLRRAYKSSIGEKWSHTKMDLSELGLTSGQAAERYDAIRHKIGVKRAAVITNQIEDAMQDKYVYLPANALNIYKLAFEELSAAMLEVKNALA